MTFDPLGDVVSSQYEEWVYPEPIMDLPGGWQTTGNGLTRASLTECFGPTAMRRLALTS